MRTRIWKISPRSAKWLASLSLATAVLVAHTPLRGDPILADSVDQLESLSHQIHDLRQVFRSMGTLDEAMRRSLALQYCHMHEGGLRAGIKSSLDLSFDNTIGAGIKVSSIGKHAKLSVSPLMSFGVGHGGKLTAMTNFCLNLQKLGGGWADLKTPEDPSKREDPYQVYNPASPGSTTEAPGVAGGVNPSSRLVSDSVNDELADLFDLSPANFLNALVEGYVSLGLDPGDPVQVRSILFGPDVAGSLSSVAELGDNPLEIPLKAGGAIRQGLSALPFLERLHNPVEALLSVEIVDHPCDSDSPLYLPEPCAAAGQLVNVITRTTNTAHALGDDLPDLVDDLRGLTSTLQNRAGLAATFWETLWSHVDMLATRTARIVSNMPTNIDAANTFADHVAELRHRRQVAQSHYNHIVQFACSDISGQWAYQVSNFAYCGYEYRFNACLSEPRIDFDVQCEMDPSFFVDLAGDTGNWFVQTWDSIEDGVKDAWGKVKNFFSSIF